MRRLPRFSLINGGEAAPLPPPADIVARLVALNAERATEEAAGTIRWLRPDYQIPKFAKGE